MCEPSAREVLRGEAVYAPTLCRRGAFAPVQLYDLVGTVAPALEVRPDAKSRVDLSHTALQLLSYVVVEMIPVVVADDEVVDLGEVSDVEDLRALEEGVGDAEGCALDEDGVNEVAHAIHLQEIARVAEPYDEVLRAVKLLQVVTHHGDAIDRADIIGAVEEELPEDLDAVAHRAGLHSLGHGVAILEAPVTIVRRVLDALQSCTRGERPEGGAVEDEVADAEEDGDDDAEGNEECHKAALDFTHRSTRIYMYG